MLTTSTCCDHPIRTRFWAILCNDELNDSLLMFMMLLSAMDELEVFEIQILLRSPCKKKISMPFDMSVS